MFEHLAHTCYRRRRRVVALWIALLVAAVAASSTLGGELRNDFTLPGAPSEQAADLLAEAGFVHGAGEQGQIVVAAADGVAQPAVRQQVTAFLDAVRTETPSVAVSDPYGPGGLVSPDGDVAIAEVSFGDADLATPTEVAADIAELRSETTFPDGVQVALGGEVFYEEAEFSSEGIGMVAAIVILLVAFGSVLAMGLPIITALFGIGIGSAIVLVAARFIDVPDFAPAAVAMVTIGVGIDYALFLVTRYREELQGGRDPEAAVVRAVDTAGRAVLFAGTTVIIALLGLLAIGLATTRSLAVAVSAGVLMAMVASLTLLPALLGFVGRTIDRFSLGRPAAGLPAERSLWYRWSRAVQRHPAPIAVVGLAVVLVLTAPAMSLRLGFGDASNRPVTDTARQAFDLVADGFGPGYNGPLFVAVDLSGDPAIDEPVLAQLDDALAATPGVASVTPAVVNDAGEVAVVQAFPTTAPQAAETAELVHALRDDVLPAVAAPDTDLLVGGAVAAVVDFADVQAERMPVFIGLVLAVSFVVLVAVFRSVVVAATAVVLNLLSIGAAYGALVAVFQWGWGAEMLGLGEPGPIEAWAPMMLFAILFGLSMDYEVFLLSRIKEEHDRTGDNATAVADGLASTARLITAAAAIMICVFGGFVLSADRALQIFGFGLAVAILVDVTVVRLLLVPSTMELLGERNWWLPRWLGRLLPDVRLDREPAGSAAAPAPAGSLQRTPTLTTASPAATAPTTATTATTEGFHHAAPPPPPDRHDRW
ncbi:MAG: MMPL family transporter [Acidimicrobiia bacterium]|nr:MMPL family transporter [Acidimicrobiia bacterium]